MAFTYLSEPTRFEDAVVETPFSRKYWSAAAESCRALFSTALSCEDWRTFWNAGIAMAASRPMMTTTIMISTRVKPLFEEWVLFILWHCLTDFGDNTRSLRCEQNAVRKLH